MQSMFDKIRELFSISTTENCGYPPGSMDLWLETFGTVPQVLADYYTTLGAHRELNDSSELHLVSPSQQSKFLDDRYLIFYQENWLLNRWGIAADDVRTPDPPVHVSSDGSEWRLVGNSLSEFLTSIAHAQAVFNFKYSYGRYWFDARDREHGIVGDAADALRKRFPSRGADSKVWGGVEFRASHPDSVILLSGPRPKGRWDLWFSSRTASHYTEMRDEITGIIDAHRVPPPDTRPCGAPGTKDRSPVAPVGSSDGSPRVNVPTSPWPSLLQPIHAGYVWRYKAEYGDLFKRLVPARGPAQTLQGELIRAVDKLWFEGQDNGNVNWGPDFDAFTNLLDWNLIGGAGGAAAQQDRPLVDARWLTDDDASMARLGIGILRHCGRIAYRLKPEFAKHEWYEEYLAARPEIAAEPDGPDPIPDLAYPHSDVYKHLMDCVVIWIRQHETPIPYVAPPGGPRSGGPGRGGELMVEFIKDAGACLATRNVMERRGRVRWMVREPSKAPADNGWRIFSVLDTSEYLADPSNFQIVSFNDVCTIEPALIGIYDLPVGSDLQIVDEDRIQIAETATGRVLDDGELYVPGNPVRDWGPRTPHPVGSAEPVRSPLSDEEQKSSSDNPASRPPPASGLSSLPRYRPSVLEGQGYPQPYPGGYHEQPFVQPRRQGKRTAGIILIVVGVIVLLGRAASVGSGTAPADTGATGPVYAATTVAVLVLFGLVPLVVGIALVSQSRRRR